MPRTTGVQCNELRFLLLRHNEARNPVESHIMKHTPDPLRTLMTCLGLAFLLVAFPSCGNNGSGDSSSEQSETADSSSSSDNSTSESTDRDGQAEGDGSTSGSNDSSTNGESDRSDGDDPEVADDQPADQGPPPPARDWLHFRGGPQGQGRTTGRLTGDIELQWQYELEEGGFLGAPLIANGRVFAVDMDGQAVAVDLATGDEIWKVDLDAFIDASPAIIGDKLIFGDLDGQLFCLNTENGERVWTKTLETSFITSVNEIEGDALAIGETGLLTRLNVETGEQVWSYTIEDRILSSPSIAENRCFLTGCNSKLYGIDLTDPQLLSDKPLAAPTGVTAAVEGELAYFSLSGGTVLCVNWKTGEEVWSHFDPRGDQEGSSCPAITENRIVIGGGSTRNVIGLNRETGELEWTFTTRRMVNGSPIVVGSVAIIGGNDGRVYLLDAESGDKLFEYECGGTLATAPAARGSTFVVSNDKGSIYCFISK